MADQKKMDELYIDVAERLALMSHAVRRKVGAVLVKGNNIISYGWNGTPTGFNNVCEITDNGELITRPEVLHAESNLLMKLLSSDQPVSSAGSTMYVTMSPCHDCAKLIIQAGITKVVYREKYRITDGLDLLEKAKIPVVKLPDR